MKAVINMEFDDYESPILKKDIFVEDTKVIGTIKSEINKYLKEHDAVIYGTEDLSHTTFYQGSVEIVVMITCDGKTFSVAEFKDFVTGSLE